MVRVSQLHDFPNDKIASYNMPSNYADNTTIRLLKIKLYASNYLQYRHIIIYFPVLEL